MNICDTEAFLLVLRLWLWYAFDFSEMNSCVHKSVFCRFGYDFMHKKEIKSVHNAGIGTHYVKQIDVKLSMAES